jgi:hypothetical protein
LFPAAAARKVRPCASVIPRTPSTSCRRGAFVTAGPRVLRRCSLRWCCWSAVRWFGYGNDGGSAARPRLEEGRRDARTRAGERARHAQRRPPAH